MKKIISLLLVIMMLLFVTACSNGGDTKNESDTKNGSETVDNNGGNEENNTEDTFFNSNNYDAVTDEPYYYSDDYYTVTTEYKLKGEIEYSLPFDITIGSTDITLLSTPFDELINNGWIAVVGGDLNEEVTLSTYKNSVLKNSDGKYATFHALNNTDDSLAYGDCVINKIEIVYDDLSLVYDGTKEAADFDFSGVSSSSTYTDVIKALGEPSNIDIIEYYRNDELSETKVTLIYASANIREVYARFDFIDDGDKIKLVNFDIST